MSDPPPGKKDAEWTCNGCGTPQNVLSGLRFHRCPACGATFQLKWHGGRLEAGSAKRLHMEDVDVQAPSELLHKQADEARLRVLELNERIRRLEMSKGSERIALLAIFVIICAAIYVIFHLTVFENVTLLNPGPLETGFGIATAIAVVTLLALRLRKAAIVRKVLKLHAERDENLSDYEGAEAALELRSVGHTHVPREEEPTKDDAPPDIIGKYVTRQRGGRVRLNLREKDKSD